jgi:hypothetical protein
MAGILDHQGIFYQQGVLSTQQFRDNILGRNLPPPVNETLTQSGLVSKLNDIGKVINVPIYGTGDENISVHYNEDEKMFPLGTFFRTTQNVNLNPYIPQNDEYVTYELTLPPNLPKPTPEGFGDKERGIYPISYNPQKFDLINKGDKKGVGFPFNVIDKYKSLNFQKESSLGIVGGQQLEKSIIDKISRVETLSNPSNDSAGYITEPVGNVVDNYVDTLRGNNQFINTLPNDAVGWNEYNSSNKIPGGSPDSAEGVEPTMSTEIRMKSLLGRTSDLQVKFTFDLLNRNNYRPLYEDSRFVGTSEEGTNGRYYIGTDKNTNRGDLITKTFDSDDFNGGNDDSSGTKTKIEGIGEPFGEPNKFFWTTGGEQNFNPKTLLYKTQQIVDNQQDEVYINQTRKYFKDKKQKRLISRGNAISELLLIDAETNGKYCRVWTVNDRYSYFNAIRNTGLFTSPTGTEGFSATAEKSSLSVLMDNGIPKYHPVINEDISERKRYMLSIENLAWADNLADLPLFEVGPGDPINGTNGRLMWFPPYDLQFDENTSANWTKTEFIGRSEPVYTYNNSVRSGSLSFKILVDHPRVINCYRGQNNNLNERFFAGCVTPEDFLEALECTVTQTDYEEIKKKLNKEKKQTVTVIPSPPENGVVKLITTVDCNVEPENCRKTMTYDQASLDAIIVKVETFVQKQNTNTNPKTKIIFNGYVGRTANRDALGEVTNEGKDLSKKYAEEVKSAVESSLNSSGIDTKILKNITYNVIGNEALETDADADYRVDVLMESDIENSSEAQPKEEVKKNATGTLNPDEIRELVDNLIIDEGAYFEYIDGNYPNYFKTISEKIKYFHPGYHSLTPEGFNTRLTFLNQCMRQGPSIYDTKRNINGNEVGVQPQNLSFGRPPICILRIGDFFYTKIAIQSLSISYDGPQFDLNPEGIGVQPMIASIQMSIDLIGGHSLSGPINRLQNALSFNYYANTEMYDVRSDYISEDGKIQDGAKLGEIKSGLLEEAEKQISLNEDTELNQIKENENLDGEDDGTNDGNPLIVITADNTKVNATITTGEIPTEIKVGNNEANSENELILEVSIPRTNQQESIPKNLSGVDVSLYGEGGFTKLASPTELETFNSDIKQKEIELNAAQATFTTTPNVANQRNVASAQLALDTANETLSKYLSEYNTKIKAVAYLSENKRKTKVTKTFTVTENGIN